MELWETWLSGKGHAHIFVYHQPPGRFNPETNDWEPLAGKQNAAKEFFVHDGKPNKLIQIVLSVANVKFPK